VQRHQLDLLSAISGRTGLDVTDAKVKRGTSALELASTEEAVEVLVEHGLDPTAEAGARALSNACRDSNLVMLSAIAELTNIDVTPRNERGFSYSGAPWLGSLGLHCRAYRLVLAAAGGPKGLVVGGASCCWWRLDSAGKPVPTRAGKRAASTGKWVLLGRSRRPGEGTSVPYRHLLRDLIQRGLWTDDVRMQLIAHSGSVQLLDLPGDLKELCKTVWEVKQRTVRDMAADSGAYIDQSQSLSIHMVGAATARLSSKHFHGWQLAKPDGHLNLRRFKWPLPGGG
jgi:hypothetical protein